MGDQKQIQQAHKKIWIELCACVCVCVITNSFLLDLTTLSLDTR